MLKLIAYPQAKPWPQSNELQRSLNDRNNTYTRPRATALINSTTLRMQDCAVCYGFGGCARAANNYEVERYGVTRDALVGTASREL
jgi:hypothetical protein